MSRFPPALAFTFVVAVSVSADDWPQFGRDNTHNAVSLEKNAPVDFFFPEYAYGESGEINTPGRGVVWQTKLGDGMIIPPVVTDGLIWIGAGAREFDDDKIPKKDWQGDLLMCFRETDGKLLWKHRSPKPEPEIKEEMTEPDPPRAKLGSVPLVERDRLWHVNNRNEVVCFDISPLKAGKGVPREVWKLDMGKELGVRHLLPFGMAASVAGHKDRLFVVTHNRADLPSRTVPAPKAPSLVCLEKATGKVIWKDNSPGKNIFRSQVSSPLVIEVNGRVQVIVGQGDGWLRSFDPATGKVFWKCDVSRKDDGLNLSGRVTHHVMAAPVLCDNRIYVSTGRDLEYHDGSGDLYCIDPTKEGDVSPEVEDGPQKWKPNPNTAVVWRTPREIPADLPRIDVGEEKPDEFWSKGSYFDRVFAGVTVCDGLVYAATYEGYFYCFDAKTGKLHWADSLKGHLWGQPLWADGKVYVGTERGDVFIYAHGKQRKLLAKIIVANDCIFAGLIFANQTLYVATDQILYAIRKTK